VERTAAAILSVEPGARLWGSVRNVKVLGEFGDVRLG
jgi:hypothetical protein